MPVSDPRTNPLLDHLAALVRARRQELGITRRTLAERTGISERFLADIENGRANPSLLRLATLAESLDVPLPELVAGSVRTRREDPLAARRVALLGLRGAGKSTVGRALAERLGIRFVELDERIEETTGLGLAEMFSLHGEDYYRRSERAALQDLVGSDEPVVVATGGGLVTERETFALLRSAFHTVWLRASPEDHWRRVLEQGDMRPMTGHEQAFNDLCRILQMRETLYAQAAWTVETSGRTVEAVVGELAGRLREAA